MSGIGKEVVGYVNSPSTTSFFEFILREKIRVGEYILVRHPLEAAYLLARVVGGTAKDESIEGVGVHLVKEGKKLGKELAFTAMKAEVLGYIREGEYRPPDFPVPPGEEVLRAKKEDVEPFLHKGDGFTLSVGVDPYSDLPVELDLNWLTKGHLGVYGMTRSGKTSFVLRLIKSGLDLVAPARFLIHDRYGEYSPLENYGVRLRYDELLSVQQMDISQLALRLGLDPTSKSEKAAVESILELLEEGELTIDGVAERMKERGVREDLIKKVRSRLETKWVREELEKLSSLTEDPPDLIELLRKNNVIIIDYSVDTNIKSQQTVFTQIINRVFARAVATRGEEFTFINVVEEAQFFAPEKGMPYYGDPWKSGSLQALSMGVSQLSGYNVGFVIVTQRPAYVAKSVLAQCNTHVIFRLSSSADHDQVSSVSGYPTWRLRDTLPNLPVHHSLLLGAASPFPFPVFLRTDVWEYPRKAGKTASEVLLEMNREGESPNDYFEAIGG